MYVGEDVVLKNLWTILTEPKSGLTAKGEEAARKAAMRVGAGYSGVKFYSPAEVKVTGQFTSKDALRTKEYTQLLISQGTDPQKSLLVQDVAEPVVETVEKAVETVKDALDPIGTFWDDYKIPLTIGGIVIGGALLLGYSGMGKPIGSAIGTRIEKGDK